MRTWEKIAEDMKKQFIFTQKYFKKTGTDGTPTTGDPKGLIIRSDFEGIKDKNNEV